MGMMDQGLQNIISAKEISEQREMQEMFGKYNHVFQGIGKIRDQKYKKDIYGQFRMNPEAVPITQSPALYHTFPETTKGWQQGAAEEIFQKVPKNNPVTMCTPLVVQHKAKSAQTPIKELHGTTYDQTQRRPPSSKQIHGTNSNNIDPY